MSEWKQYVEEMVAAPINKMVLSHPKSKSEEYKKISIQKKKDFFQIEKYTDKQVFHENVKADALLARCVELIDNHYLQVNAWTDTLEYALLISKKGKCSFKKIGQKGSQKPGTKQPGGCQSGNCAVESHNRKKQYLLEEGSVIPPLVDMGIFTQEGKVVRSMYDKYRQINRFIELIDDAVRDLDVETLHVIDFGCGKSYLTFILYYYLTEIRNIRAEIIGLDLKEDVIVNCNAAAQKYGYSGLRFEMGDINGYKTPFDVDMVITLHACDTATDFALYNAIQWNAKMIFSVPCCQHELNRQITSQILEPVLKYGLIKERMAALVTDAIRANLLEEQGYQVQVMEFIDMEHTPKNILIRAVKDGRLTKKKKKTGIEETAAFLGVENTLQKLLEKQAVR